jgi:hypothetical protein
MKNVLVTLLLLIAGALPAYAAPCEDVRALKAANVTITATSTVAATVQSPRRKLVHWSPCRRSLFSLLEMHDPLAPLAT